MVTNEEIIKTHSQGFGGSDAKMFAKIGRNGVENLSTTELKRVAQVLGKLPFTTFHGNVYTEAGHLFEDFAAEKIPLSSQPQFKREYLMTDNAIKPLGFTVFAHADFYIAHQGKVVECKYAQDDTPNVVETYAEQLQWYYMLGAQRVTLLHGWGGVLPFIPENWEFVEIPFDEELVNTMMQGINLLDEAIAAHYFDDLHFDDWAVTELDTETFNAVAALNNAVAMIEQHEKAAADARAKILAAMEQRGVLSITGDGFRISYVAPTTRRTFDTKKAQAKFPELTAEEFYKTSNVKSTIKITTK